MRGHCQLGRTHHLRRTLNKYQWYFSRGAEVNFSVSEVNTNMRLPVPAHIRSYLFLVGAKYGSEI